MAKTIKFHWKKDERDYLLEFTRETAQRLENAGFSIADLANKPNNMIPLLWHGAFLAHHKKTKDSDIDEMYDSIVDKQGLLERLGEMYRDTTDTLVDEPDEGDEKNIEWEANW